MRPSPCRRKPQPLPRQSPTQGFRWSRAIPCFIHTSTGPTSVFPSILYSLLASPSPLIHPLARPFFPLVGLPGPHAQSSSRPPCPALLSTQVPSLKRLVTSCPALLGVSAQMQGVIPSIDQLDKADSMPRQFPTYTASCLAFPPHDAFLTTMTALPSRVVATLDDTPPMRLRARQSSLGA